MTAFVQSAFKAYWTANADLSDQITVLKLARDSGLILTEEALSSVTKALPDHQFQAEESGVFTTPTYRINDQLFVGREHLPWISSLIDDND